MTANYNNKKTNINTNDHDKNHHGNENHDSPNKTVILTKLITALNSVGGPDSQPGLMHLELHITWPAPGADQNVRCPELPKVIH